jgi:cytochrome c-type biogenesis protein CcsB
LGSVLTPIALLINAFASFSLPAELRQISPLVPALQSNWLMMHVSVMMLSYTALISGCLFSIVFLILTKFQDIQLQETIMGNMFNDEKNQEDQKSETQLLDLKYETTLNNFYSLFDENSQLKISNNIEHAKTFDNLSYRTLSLGFSFLTIGILSGAVWANEAWGSYWSWDPKETWALITWIIFAIYLHTRLNRGWQGRNSALIAVLGLIIVCICYLGVNFLGKGLHSYGFLN